MPRLNEAAPMEILVLPLVIVEEPRDVVLFPREIEEFPNIILDFSLLIDVFPRLRAVLPSVMLVLPMVEEKKILEVSSSGQPRRPGARSGLNFLCSPLGSFCFPGSTG